MSDCQPDLASRLPAWFPTAIRQGVSLPAGSAKLADIQFREWRRLVKSLNRGPVVTI